jgi:UDP-N-acetylglucosamine--N-acetylmuramyl-(pentapeptide) pyrophosphoryl-undecaprenol N-acetylglucosamine transferase
MKELKRVLIMAGGTGGHVFPGLAMADYLRKKGIEVHWLGTQLGIEARLVPEAGFPLHLIAIRGVRGKGIKSLLAAPFAIAAAVKQSRHIIQKMNPDIVIGLGGFVSGPGGIASWLARRPLLIHEQNAKAGFTNKILAFFAKRILAGFPTAFKPQSKLRVVGNPVRVELEHLATPKERFLSRHASCRLLILGGSLGAQALNEVVPRALAKMNVNERPEILHQTGDKHIDNVKNLYRSMNLEADLTPFIKDMAHVYSWADMVLCRAGALTVAELCAVGLGAIFVPFPLAVDDHQTANASFMVNHQAALCIQQSELTDERLVDILREFSQSAEKRLSMAESAYELRQVDVVDKIYAICKEVCH